MADARRRRFTEAQDHLGRALDLVRAAGDRAGEGECLFVLSYLHWLQGDRPDARRRAQESLELFRESDESTWAGKASLAVGWYLVEEGDPFAALPYYTEALALQQSGGDLANLTVSELSLGWLLGQIEQYESAAHHLAEGLRIARRFGNLELQAQALDSLGDLDDALGDRAAAAQRWQEAYEILNTLSHPRSAELRRKLAAGLMPEPTAGGFGRQLRHHRLRQGMTQEDLAARAGVSVRTIRSLEGAQGGRPRPVTVQVLGDALRLSPAARRRFDDAAFDDR